MHTVSYHYEHTRNHLHTRGAVASQAAQVHGRRLDRMRIGALSVIIIVSLTIVALIVAWTGDHEVQAAGAVSLESEMVPASEQVIVMPGDTLWSISEKRVRKDEDIRTYIQKLKKLNKLTSSEIQAGQVLSLP